MIKYRNVRHGKVVERPAEDEWLEASGTWERIDEPADEPAAEDDIESEDD